MRIRILRLLGAAAAAALTAACTSHVIIRDRIAQSDPAQCDYAPADPGAAGWTYHRCDKFAVEVHPLAGAPGGAFKLAFVEFDDQGWFYRYQENDANRGRRVAVASQMQLLEDLLEAEGKARDLIIVAYVHGWKHDADVCNEDVGCFREVLRAIQEAEVRQYGAAARRVIGIYVAWRGREVAGPGDAQYVTFYSRKNAATHVALGSVRELFAWLGKFHRHQNDPARVRAQAGKDSGRAGRTRLVTVGHSFGGLILFAAVSPWLLQNVVDGDETVEPFGDLVVLVNPAFEAVRYEPLYHAAGRRAWAGRGQRQPVFVAVTSDSDWATRYAFPLGRSVNTLFEQYAQGEGVRWKIEREANLRTIGHADRYRTHRLTLAPGAPPPAQQTAAEGPCRCLSPVGRWVESDSPGEARARRQAFDRQWRDADGRSKEGWERHYGSGVVLTHLAGQSDPDNPFWVVSTDSPIIDGHGDFYTPYFLGFLRELYDDLLLR